MSVRLCKPRRNRTRARRERQDTNRADTNRVVCFRRAGLPLRGGANRATSNGPVRGNAAPNSEGFGDSLGKLRVFVLGLVHNPLANIPEVARAGGADRYNLRCNGFGCTVGPQEVIEVDCLIEEYAIRVVQTNLLGARGKALNPGAVFPGKLKASHFRGRPSGWMKDFKKFVLLLVESPHVAGNVLTAYEVLGFILALGLHENVAGSVPLSQPGQVTHNRPRNHHVARFGDEQPTFGSEPFE